MRVLDVGCGPGGLTAELVARVGAEAVAAIDPSPPFVRACQERHPGVDVREGVAEALPFDDDAFDASVSSLVVGFLSDADAGVREMLRVTRPRGVVAACFWSRTGMPALRTFWRAAASLDERVPSEPRRLGTDEGDIAALLERAGAVDIEHGAVAGEAAYTGFDDWWDPFTLGIGPAGAYVRSLDQARAPRARGGPCSPRGTDGAVHPGGTGLVRSRHRRDLNTAGADRQPSARWRKKAVASARVLSPSLARMLDTWCSTVRRLRNSRPAMSEFDNPTPRSTRIPPRGR